MTEENKSISVDELLESRKNQAEAVKTLSSRLQELQNEATNTQSNLQLNQGALMQINLLLKNLGVDVDIIDSNESVDNTDETSE
tara:strand:- start:1956 stop:2207 length:252 start_codon:yes stop_codon:yes gene_type:complete